jgi:hypothetical protein
MRWCPCRNEHTTTDDTFWDIVVIITLENGTHSEGGPPPFPSPHSMLNGYPYYFRWLLDLDGCHHCLPDSHKYGTVSIDDDIISIDDGYSREDIIIH